jgi:hypothetical protein
VHGGSTIEFTAPAMTIVTVLARLEPDGVAGTVGR